MDYYGQPAVKTYIKMMAMAIDVKDNEAAIPGDGNMPVAFTYTFDVAKFTVALLDVKEWPEKIYICGDKLTFNELLAKSEKVKGQSTCTCVSIHSSLILMNLQERNSRSHMTNWRMSHKGESQSYHHMCQCISSSLKRGFRGWLVCFLTGWRRAKSIIQQVRRLRKSCKVYMS